MARKTKKEDPMVALPIEEAAKIMEAVAAAGEGATVEIEQEAPAFNDVEPDVELEGDPDVVMVEPGPKFIYAKASAVAGRMVDPFSKVSFPEDEFVPTEPTNWVMCQIEAGLLIKRIDAAN